MKRLSVLALTAALAMTACSHAGSSVAVPQPMSGATLDAYRLPLATSMAVESAARSAQFRSKQGSYGGVPTVDGGAYMTDAPKFGPGAQVNLAVVGVDAIANDGTAYPIVEFASPVVVNVLDYQHSALKLGNAQIPAIMYKGVELVVKPSQSAVVVAGRTYPMVFGKRVDQVFTRNPNALAGVYYSSAYDATTGAPVSFLMDFNVNEWVSLNHNYAEVAPKGHATTYDRSSVIVGSVVNATGGPVSLATVEAVRDDGSTAAIVMTGDNGNFEIHAIDAGRYHLLVHNVFGSDTLGQLVTAVGADGSGTVSGPQVDVPAGFRINVGQIAD